MCLCLLTPALDIRSCDKPHPWAHRLQVLNTTDYQWGCGVSVSPEGAPYAPAAEGAFSVSLRFETVLAFW